MPFATGRQVFSGKADCFRLLLSFSLEALDYLREGDTLVVWKLDRLGRSLKDLIEKVEELQERGADFKSLQEGIDTTTSTGKLVFHEKLAKRIH